MKKVLLTIAVMVAMFAASAYAGENYNVNYSQSYDVVHKLNERATFNKVMRYLQLDYRQADDLRYVFGLTEKKMNEVKNGNPDEVNKVLYFNLANAKSILSKKQYKKYLTLLNVSIQNQEVSFIAEK